MSSSGKKLTIRMPEELYTRLESLAEEDMRSINAEAVMMIKESIEFREEDDELHGPKRHWHRRRSPGRPLEEFSLET